MEGYFHTDEIPKKRRKGGRGGREGGREGARERGREGRNSRLTLGCSKQAGQFSLIMGRRLLVAKAFVSPSRV